MDDKIYNLNDVISFAKITGDWGYFSNMSQCALFVNETYIPSSEALYQACKYPLFPSIQKEIIDQNNAVKAKVISRKYSQFQRQDWEIFKISIMRWSLTVKLLQHWDNLSDLLQKTVGYDIVEYSSKDSFWGAVPCGNHQVMGKNILGRLLMELRDEYVIHNKKPHFIAPLQISSFQLLGSNISRVYSTDYYSFDDFD